MNEQDQIVKVPFYWGQLFSTITEKEVGIIIKIIFRYCYGEDVKSKDTNDYIMFRLSVKAKDIMHLCLNDIDYQIMHQDAYMDEKAIRRSNEYKTWRMAVFERDGFTCQFCHRKGGVLNAHHIRPFSKFPELRLDVDNGITLCELCHKAYHKTHRNGRYEDLLIMKDYYERGQTQCRID